MKISSSAARVLRTLIVFPHSPQISLLLQRGDQAYLDTQSRAGELEFLLQAAEASVDAVESVLLSALTPPARVASASDGATAQRDEELQRGEALRYQAMYDAAKDFPATEGAAAAAPPPPAPPAQPDPAPRDTTSSGGVVGGVRSTDDFAKSGAFEERLRGAGSSPELVGLIRELEERVVGFVAKNTVLKTDLEKSIELSLSDKIPRQVKQSARAVMPEMLEDLFNATLPTYRSQIVAEAAARAEAISRDNVATIFEKRRVVTQSTLEAHYLERAELQNKAVMKTELPKIQRKDELEQDVAPIIDERLKNLRVELDAHVTNEISRVAKEQIPDVLEEHAWTKSFKEKLAAQETKMAEMQRRFAEVENNLNRRNLDQQQELSDRVDTALGKMARKEEQLQEHANQALAAAEAGRTELLQQRARLGDIERFASNLESYNSKLRKIEAELTDVRGLDEMHQVMEQKLAARVRAADEDWSARHASMEQLIKARSRDCEQLVRDVEERLSGREWWIFCPGVFWLFGESERKLLSTES